MRSKMVRTLALALLLGGVGISSAQQQGGPATGSSSQGSGAMRPPNQKTPPEKSRLEEMLSEALKNNPDIRVAAAQLAEVEAKLNRTRVQVMQKVVTLHQAILSQKAVIDVDQKQYDRLKRLSESGSVDVQLMEKASADLLIAKAKLEELESQMPGLLGKSPHANPYQQYLQEGKLQRPESIPFSLRTRRPMLAEAEWEWTFKATGPMADKIRKALSLPMSVEFRDRAVTEVTKELSRITGLVIKYVPDRRFPMGETVAIDCTDMPLAAILQLLGDSLPHYSIVVRDYGLLIAPSQDVPSGAISVAEFLRQKPTDSGRKDSADGQSFNAGMPWDPPDKIEGAITRIDLQGFVILSLNTVDGLLNGHTLHLYRPSDEPSKNKYLGTIRIVQLAPPQNSKNLAVVAQPIGRFPEPPKVGDKVSARMPRGAKLPAKEKRNPSDAEKKPPAEDMEGLVKSIDAGGLFTISLGSDAGLAKEPKMELYWKPHKPPIEDAHPFGTIRPVETEAHQAVAQSVGRLSHIPQTGDRFIGRIMKK